MIAPAETLVTQACEQAGCDDFGPGDWRTGLEALVAAFNETRFAPEVAAGFEQAIVSALTGRLQMEGWIKAHPGEFAASVVERPFMIQGLPRTASTALQNVLAEDPQWRFLRGWESETIHPPPVLGEEASDPRFLREKAFIEQDATFAGKHIHNVGGPVEDTALLRLNFGAQEGGWPVFSYMRAWRDRSLADTFAYHKRALRFLQARRPPTQWLLKSPPFAFHLDDLVETYPDAIFVMTHRDPVRILPSVCSLTVTRLQTYLPDEAIDRRAMGRFFLEHWRIAMDRALQFRRTHGDARFLDVQHEAFNRDPIGVLRRVYGHLDRDLTPQIQAAMTKWLSDHRRGFRGEHTYTAEEFGLSDAEIADAFFEYRRSAGIAA